MRWVNLALCEEVAMARRAKEFLKKLTGLSTPFGGVSWKPLADERDVIYRLLQQLGNRRLMDRTHGAFGFPRVIRSLEQMRNDLTAALTELPSDSPLRGILEDARADLQHFQTFVEDEFSDNGHIDRGPSEALLEALWAIRKGIGAKVAFLSNACDVPLSKDLLYHFHVDEPRKVETGNEGGPGSGGAV